MASGQTDAASLEPSSAEDAHRNLSGFEEVRSRELTLLLRPAVDIINRYEALLVRIVWACGEVPPPSDQERVVRDLMADTFDFLRAWRQTILAGLPHVAYPLARRAYESLSLMSACIQDEEWTKRWQRGDEMSTNDVRKKLAASPMAEDIDALRDLYKFFSKAAHPNRDLVPSRQLGEGNRFVLGAIGVPDPLITLDHVIRLLGMWFWFAAASSYHARNTLANADPNFHRDYMSASKVMSEVAEWLTQSYNATLKHSREVGSR